MARRGGNNEDLSNVEFETSEDVEVVPTFNSMVSLFGTAKAMVPTNNKSKLHGSIVVPA